MGSGKESDARKVAKQDVKRIGKAVHSTHHAAEAVDTFKESKAKSIADSIRFLRGK